MQSIVTSSAQNDSGLFETNLHDERYLPFEHFGLESHWQLELPANPMNDDPAQFDYATISDVVLHLRYTARAGGTALRHGAVARLRELIGNAQAAGSVRLLSIRHEFPDAWARFTGAPAAQPDRFQLSLPLSPQLYPFWGRKALGSVRALDVLAVPSAGAQAGKHDKVFKHPAKGEMTTTAELKKDGSLGNLLRGAFAGADLPPKPDSGSIELYFDGNVFDDVWVAITWGS